MTSSTECDLEKEFECESGNVTCIPRSFVNNRKNDCLDASDEKVHNFTYFDFEFECLSYTYSEVLKNIINKIESKAETYIHLNIKKNKFYQCLSYNNIRDGKSSCVFDTSKKKTL